MIRTGPRGTRGWIRRPGRCRSWRLTCLRPQPEPGFVRLEGWSAVDLYGPGPAPARAAVRLADLVAALSLGVDLGFGQPMEHVLRQCLIALRLAERAGLDEQHRATVYYTALLVNVGCHAD